MPEQNIVMKELKYASLPDWIQSSALCLNQMENLDQDANNMDLDVNEDLVVVCPSEYSNFNVKIQSNEDIVRLLTVIEYWGVENLSIPFELFDYMFYHLDCIDDIERNIHYDLKILTFCKSVLAAYHNIQELHNNSLPIKVCGLIALLQFKIKVSNEYIDFCIGDSSERIAQGLAVCASEHGLIEVLELLPHRELWLFSRDDVS